MFTRVQRFIPELNLEDLATPGTAGIRSSVIDGKGNFMKEAIELETPNAFHILNYNSPGATGAPAYTAYLAGKLMACGKLSSLKKKTPAANGLWNFETITKNFEEIV